MNEPLVIRRTINLSVWIYKNYTRCTNIPLSWIMFWTDLMYRWAAVIWLKYYRYGVKLDPTNQSINVDDVLLSNQLREVNIIRLTGFEDNSNFVWPENGSVAPSRRLRATDPFEGQTKLLLSEKPVYNCFVIHFHFFKSFVITLSARIFIRYFSSITSFVKSENLGDASTLWR